MGGVTRKHYIMSEEVKWNYAPKGRNGITGEPFGDAEAIFVTDFIGSTYLKCLYHECVVSLPSSCAMTNPLNAGT
jgi:manganese oxidase